MLTEDTLNYFLRLFEYNNRFVLTPLIFNTTSRTLTVTKSKRHWQFYSVILIYFTLDCNYLTFVFWKFLHDKRTPFEITMKVCIHWFTRLITLFLHYFMFWQGEKLALFYNQLFEFHSKLQRAYSFRQILADFEKNDSDFRRVCKVFYYTTMFYPIVPALNYFGDYQSLHYWPSNFTPNPNNTHFLISILLRIPFCIVEWYITAIGVYASVFFGAMLVLQIKVVTFWISVLCNLISKMGENITIYSLIRFGIIKYYRGIQIMNIIYNEAWKSLVTPASIFFTLSTHAMLNYGMIEIKGSMPTIVLSTASILFVILEHTWFRSSGKLYESSLNFRSKLLASHSKIVRKKVSSFNHLSLQVGTFYHVKPSTLLTYFSIITEYTIHLLLYRPSHCVSTIHYVPLCLVSSIHSFAAALAFLAIPNEQLGTNFLVDSDPRSLEASNNSFEFHLLLDQFTSDRSNQF